MADLVLLNFCGSLSENGPPGAHRFDCLVPSWWNCLGRDKEVQSYCAAGDRLSGFKSPGSPQGPLLLSSSMVCISQFLFQSHACLLVTMLPALTVMDSSNEMVDPQWTLSSRSCLGHGMVPYHSNWKVTYDNLLPQNYMYGSPHQGSAVLGIKPRALCSLPTQVHPSP